MGVSSIKVLHVSELEEGDHIKWKRLPGYDHHAIVERVDHEIKRVHVIEYGSQTGERRIIDSGVRIQRRIIYGVETMYKYIYDTCFDAVTVLDKARSRLGEAGYNVFKNNCEHFATWCKTGYKKCSQIRSFICRIVSGIAEGASGAGGTVLGRCAAKGAVAAAEKGTTILKEISLSVRNAGKLIGHNALKSGCKVGVIGVTSILCEGALFGYNRYKAQQNYKDALKRVGDDAVKQNCLKQQRNKNIREAAYEGVGAAVMGTAIGVAIGSFIPVVGTVIGALVGSVGGRILGRLFGRLIHR